MAAQIIDDVRLRQIKHAPWLEGRSFIPLPTSYLNGERWNDEIINGALKNGTKQTETGNTTHKSSRVSEAVRRGLDEYEEILRKRRERQTS